jgi:hypothetical protein
LFYRDGENSTGVLCEGTQNSLVLKEQECTG